MLNEYMEQIEGASLWFFLSVLFFLIGMAIQDVLKKGDVPKFGRVFVWIVLFLGCAGFLAKGNGFREALHEARNAYLVDHLGQLPATTGPHVCEGAAEAGGHGCDVGKDLCIAPTHHSKLAVLCAHLPA